MSRQNFKIVHNATLYSVSATSYNQALIAAHKLAEKEGQPKLITTLYDLRAYDDCLSRLLASLPNDWHEDEPISLRHILNSLGPQDTIWALRAASPYSVAITTSLHLVADTLEQAWPNGHWEPWLSATITAIRDYADKKIAHGHLISLHKQLQKQKQSLTSFRLKGYYWIASQTLEKLTSGRPAWSVLPWLYCRCPAWSVLPWLWCDDRALTDDVLAQLIHPYL